jgi:translation initiation factor 2 subunit 1
MASSDEEIPKGAARANLNCRFYRQCFPKVDELVMVEVLHVDQVGASVSLLEYNGIEGLIMLGELSKKRIRSVTKLTRVGRKEVVTVIRVDQSKGYLDLSKKQVTAENISECEKKFQKAKSVNNILRHVAQTTSTDIEKLYETIGWPLYEKYEHALDAFKIAVTEPEKVFEGLEMTPEIRESLLYVIRNRLAPQAIRISSEFSVTCFEYEGIDSIKAALSAGRDLDAEKVKIRLIAAPLYSMVITTVHKTQGLELANASLKRISEEILKLKGSFSIKEAPHVIDLNTGQEADDFLAKHLNPTRPISDIEEDNDETMGDVDLGIDTAEIDARNAAIRDEDDDDD